MKKEVGKTRSVLMLDCADIPETDPKRPWMRGVFTRYLTVQEVSEITGFAVRTLYNWRSSGSVQGPKGVMLSGSLRYDIRDLEAWIKENLKP